MHTPILHNKPYSGSSYPHNIHIFIYTVLKPEYKVCQYAKLKFHPQKEILMSAYYDFQIGWLVV